MQLVEEVLNQILEKQVTEALGAEKHERTEERAGYRNGYRERTLFSRVGPLNLRVPQTRDGSFSVEIFQRYQRSEQAFLLALMEMVVKGVSTRKVTEITEQLCGASFFEVDGGRAVRVAGTAGEGLQQPSPGGSGVPIRSGRRHVLQELGA